MVIDPVLHAAGPDHRGVLVWSWPQPRACLSSASVGGGLGRTSWIVNVGVPSSYCRTDLDTHAEEVATSLGLDGTGIALFTAADVSGLSWARCGGVAVHATVGLSHPTWAADNGEGSDPLLAGTINVVVQVPAALGPGAAVNAVITATEAKSQALFARGIQGTGTASDAVVVIWPVEGEPARFGGPRSRWGSLIARATHDAVLDGIRSDR